jgi:outer membrane protein assembly factor BamD (BamD/ComL family)
MFTTQPYMRRFFLPSIFFATLLLSAPSFADDVPTAQDIKRAARAYDQGRERFREEQYVEAAEKFEIADSYAPSAAALRLAIFARKEAGQIDRALTHHSSPL